MGDKDSLTPLAGERIGGVDDFVPVFGWAAEVLHRESDFSAYVQDSAF